MSGVLIGGGNAGLEDLSLVPVPESTATYVPGQPFRLGGQNRGW